MKDPTEQSIELATKYLDKVVDAPLGELSGLLTDTVGYWRFKNKINMLLKAKDFLEKKGIDPKKALPDTVVPLLPEHRSFAYLRRGNIYRDAGKHGEALAAYDEAIRLTPDGARPYAERGSLHLMTKDYAKAISDMNRVLAIDSDKYLAYAVRGVARFNLGDIDEGLADLTEALRRQPDNKFALGNRGRVFEAKGDLENARVDYEAAAKLDPDDEWLKRALERVR